MPAGRKASGYFRPTAGIWEQSSRAKRRQTVRGATTGRPFTLRQAPASTEFGSTYRAKNRFIRSTSSDEPKGAAMNRRSYLTGMLAAVVATKAIPAQQTANSPIVLYCDLTVDPSREQ